MLHLTVEQARGFYAEHDGKPFFDGLVEFMTSGPIVVSVLEGENAVQRHRDLLGATNPANALAGTLRADYADSLTENGTHGSEDVYKRQVGYYLYGAPANGNTLQGQLFLRPLREACLLYTSRCV